MKRILTMLLAALAMAETIQAQPAVLTTLANFNGTNGGSPRAGLTLGLDGNFYGTTQNGGNNNYGTVFRVTTNGALTSLLKFAGTNGANPFAELSLGADGSFYGSTYSGGSSNYGSVFRVTTNGALTLLAQFTGANGEYPVGGLTLGGDGNFYGTTQYGGINGSGTVFRITTNGILTTLANFANTNGSASQAALTVGGDGNFYGVTTGGGNTNGNGTVFKVTTNGALTLLAQFAGTNGASPEGALTLGGDGNFYGTAYGGGGGLGTMFKVTTNGALTTLISLNGINGSQPVAGLLLAKDGNFYGTAAFGGSDFNGSGPGSGSGTIYKLTTGGVFVTLANFISVSSANPECRLTQGPDGNFYGTTYSGGTGNWGTVFKLTVSPPPAVGITTINNKPVVIWPASVSNYFSLQFTTNLASGNWIWVTSGVPFVGIEITNSPSPAYFRLR